MVKNSILGALFVGTSFLNAQIFVPSGKVNSTTSNNGNVGVGIDNPTHKLTVQGSLYSTAYTLQADSPQLILQRNTTYGGYLQGIQTRLLNNQNNWFFGNMGETKWIVSKGDYTGVLFEINQVGNAYLKGKFETREIKVTKTPTADFVFADDYALPKLEDVEKHIKEKRHLPEIASAAEMEKEGVNIGEFQIKLLQKIEELTLYSIQQEKRINQLEEKLSKAKK